MTFFRVILDLRFRRRGEPVITGVHRLLSQLMDFKGEILLRLVS